MFQKAAQAAKVLDSQLFGALAKNYENLLETEILSDCESVLDVACGSASPIRGFSHRLKHSVGVDGFEPSIEKSRQAGIHSEYRKMNVLEIGDKFAPGSFDAVVALDLIEHLEKPDAQKLIQMMERIAAKKIIIFTPNGFLPQGEFENNAYQRHVSGWSVSEMRELGYKVYGVNGWKPLRGEFARVRFKPETLWNRISWLTQPLVLNRPEMAFQILCVKEKGK